MNFDEGAVVDQKQLKEQKPIETKLAETKYSVGIKEQPEIFETKQRSEKDVFLGQYTDLEKKLDPTPYSDLRRGLEDVYTTREAFQDRLAKTVVFIEGITGEKTAGLKGLLTDFHKSIEEKADYLWTKLTGGSVSSMKDAFGTNPETNAEIVSNYEDELKHCHQFMEICGDSLLLIAEIVGSDQFTKEAETKLSSFLNAMLVSTKEDDELVRQKALHLALTGVNIPDTDRFLITPDYAEGMIERVKIENSIEGAQKSLQFATQDDPVQLPERLFSDEEPLQLSKDRQVILMSARFQFTSLKAVFEQAKSEALEGTAKNMQDELETLIKGLSDRFIKISSDMVDGIEKETERSDEEKVEQYLLLSGDMAILFGHMKSVYAAFAGALRAGEDPDMMKTVLSELKFLMDLSETKEAAGMDRMALLTNAEAILSVAEQDLFKKTEVDHEAAVKAFLAEKSPSLKEKETVLKEEIKTLSEEKKELEKEIKPEKDIVKEIRINYVKTKEEGLVPKEPAGKISPMQDLDLSNTKDIKKASKLLLDDKEHRQEYVREYLKSAEGVTDRKLAGFSNYLIDRSGVLTSKHKGEEATKIKLLEELKKAADSKEIREAMNKADGFLPAETDETTEIPLDSPFFKEHPYAAKIVVIQKLLHTMGPSDLLSSVTLLYNALVTSDEYQNEVAKQRTEKIEGKLTGRERELESIGGYREMLDEMKDSSKAFKEDRKKADELQKTGLTSQGIENNIQGLLSSIDKARLDKLEEIPAPHMEIQKGIRLDKGAVERIRTLLKKDFFSDWTDENRKEIESRILIGIPFLTAKEKAELLEEKEVEGLILSITKRLRAEKNLKVLLLEDKDYKRHVLDAIVAGVPYLSKKEFSDRAKQRRSAVRKAKSFLLLDERFTKKPVKIRVLRGAPVQKARERVYHINDLNGSLRSGFASINMAPPQDYYTFKKEHPDETMKEDKIRELYKIYLQNFFKIIKNAHGKKDKLDTPWTVNGKKYRTWSSIEKLIEKNYIEYGADESLGEFFESMGDSFYQKGEDDFHKILAQKREEYIHKEVPKRSQKTEDLAAEEQFHQRLDRLLLNGKEDYTPLAEILVNDERILEHLAADSDEEFEIFLAHTIPSCRAVTEELSRHIYRDQYLIEREKEISAFIAEGKTENAENALALTELDKAIDQTKIGKKTFKTLFGERLGIGKKIPSGENAVFASIFMEMSLSMGAAAFLDEWPVKVKRDRLQNNLKSFEDAYKSIIKNLNLNLTKKQDEALFTLLLQIEKRNLIEKAPDAYKEDLTYHLREDLDQYIKELKGREKEKKRLEAMKTAGAAIVEEKIKGRERINELFKESHKGFSLFTAKDLKELEPEDQIRKELVAAVNMSEDFTSDDPLMEVIYRSFLEKMVVAAQNKNLDQIRADMGTLLRFKCFSLAANRVIKSRKDIAETDRFAMKKGLLEAFSDQIFSDIAKDTSAMTEGVEYYTAQIEDLLGKEKTRRGIARFLIDDEDSYGKKITKPLKDEEQFKERMTYVINQRFSPGMWSKLKDKLEGSSREDLCMIAYIMQNMDTTATLKSAVTNLIGSENHPFIDVEDSAAATYYIRGETINRELLGVDFQRLTVSLSSDALTLYGNLNYAMQLLDELKAIRAKKSKEASQQKEEGFVETELILADMERARGTVESCMAELSKKKELSNDDKLWTLYTVLRSYSDVYDQFRMAVDYGRIATEKNKRLDAVCEVYGRLQEYFQNEEKDPEVVKKIYGIPLIESLDIMDFQGFKDEKTKAYLIDQEIGMEKKREEISKVIQNYAYEKAGLSKRPQKRVLDPDEETFPKTIVNQAKKIDRWIAEHYSHRRGDSSADFALEILSHPLRERLLAYYLIENGKENLPTELDAAVAMQAYVPDVSQFAKKMEKNVFYQVTNFAREIDMVESLGMLDSVGKYATSKIETCLRMLDNKAMKLDQYMEEGIAGRKAYGDPNLPEEVKFRQTCYMVLLEEMAKLRVMIKEKSEKELEKSDDIARQERSVKRAIRRLIRANEEVKRIGLKDEITDAFSVEGVQVPWTFDEEKLEYKPKSTGLLELSGALFNVTCMIVAGKTITEPDLSASARLKNIANTAEKGGYAIGRINTYGSFVKGAAGVIGISGIMDMHVGVIAKGVGKFISLASSTTKVCVAVSQGTKLKKAKKDALQLAEKIDEQQKEEQKEEQKKPERTTKEVVNGILHIQDRALRNEICSNAMRAVSSLSSCASAVFCMFPHVSSGLGHLSDVITVTRLIFNFWARADQRKQTIDEFLKLDDLCKEVRPMISPLDKKTKVKYGYSGLGSWYGLSDEALKDKLRMEVLRQLHFSSMEEFFVDISHRYARVIYRHIFFDEKGDPILAGNEAAIKERQPLCALFQNLKFKYPIKPGDFPHPPVERLGWDLCRGIK